MIVMKPQYSTKLFNEIYEDVDSFMEDYGALGFPKTITDQNAQILYYLMFSRYGNSPIANYDENQFKVKLQAITWQFGPTWQKRLDIQSALRSLSQSDMLNGGSRLLNVTNTGSTNTTGTNGNTRTLDTTDNQSGGDYTNTLTGGNTKATASGAVITNHASNPGEMNSSKTTTDPTELTYIDSQTAQIDKDRVTVNERTSAEVTAHTRDSADVATHTGTISDAATNSSNVTTNSTAGHNETRTKAILDAYAELWELLDNDVTNDFLVKFKPLFKIFARPEETFIYVTEEDDND